MILPVVVPGEFPISVGPDAHAGIILIIVGGADAQTDSFIIRLIGECKRIGVASIIIRCDRKVERDEAVGAGWKINMLNGSGKLS